MSRFKVTVANFIIEHGVVWIKLIGFKVKQFIKQAIAEDIGDGDHTSLACIPADAVGRMKLIVKPNNVHLLSQYLKSLSKRA